MKKIFLLMIIWNLLAHYAVAGINNWQEVNPSQVPTHLKIYQGPAYPDVAFKQEGQDLVLDLDDFHNQIQWVKYRLNETGSWTQITAGFPYTNLGNVTNVSGIHLLELKLGIVTGGEFPTNHNLLVVPDAPKSYEDNNGNLIMQWGQSGSSQNPALLVEGFDPANKNNPNLYYAVGKDVIEDVLSAGKTFYVLNFSDGGADLNDNQVVVKSAIKLLNDLSDNELIVSGMSMGGVLARHALVSLENESYNHNTSKFISLDAPQDGAVMDLDFLDEIYDTDSDHPSLSSTAAKQLLQETPFDSENLHSQYYNNLRNLNSNNGYPENSINIGVAFASSDLPDNLNEKWLTIDRPWPLSDLHYNIEANKDIYQAGSKLPISTTAQTGWVSLWLYIDNWQFIRYEHPTFIPYESALDISGGQTRFDVVLSPSTGRYFHDEIPESIKSDITTLFIGYPHEFTQSTTIGSGDYPSGAIIHDDVTVTIQSGAEVTMSHKIIMEELVAGSDDYGQLQVDGELLITENTDVEGGRILVRDGGKVDIGQNASSDSTRIQVDQGGEIDIASGAHLQFGAGHDQRFHVYGQATIRGTLESSASWQGLVFHPPSTGSLQGCQISSSIYGIQVNGADVEIQGCQISNAVYGIEVTGAEVPIQGSHIYDNMVGIRFNNVTGSETLIKDNLLTDNSTAVLATIILPRLYRVIQ